MSSKDSNQHGNLRWVSVFTVTTQLAHSRRPPTTRQQYAIEWRINGGPLVASWE